MSNTGSPLPKDICHSDNRISSQCQSQHFPHDRRRFLHQVCYSRHPPSTPGFFHTLPSQPTEPRSCREKRPTLEHCHSFRRCPSLALCQDPSRRGTFPYKLFASPPSEKWPNGQCDTVIFLIDGEGGPERPPPGLDGILPISVNLLILTNAEGFFVGKIRAIFHPMWKVPTKRPLCQHIYF